MSVFPSTTASAACSSLPQEDFEVFEDGAPQKIAFFAHSADVPLDLGLIVDFSGSQAEFIKAHHKDLDAFLKKALSSRDRVFLVCFGNHVRLAQDFTDQPRDIIDALHGFEKQGGGGLFEFAPHERRILGTAFYDALYYSIGERLAASAGARKALIVFSDGEDNSSGHHMLEAIEAAQTNDVLLFPIRYTEKLKGGPIARNRYGIEVMARTPRDRRRRFRRAREGSRRQLRGDWRGASFVIPSRLSFQQSAKRRHVSQSSNPREGSGLLGASENRLLREVGNDCPTPLHRSFRNASTRSPIASRTFSNSCPESTACNSTFGRVAANSSE